MLDEILDFFHTIALINLMSPRVRHSLVPIRVPGPGFRRQVDEEKGKKSKGSRAGMS